MNDAELISEIAEQDYPLSITKRQAEAMTRCIQRIMSTVYEDDRILVRHEFDLVTSALSHPAEESK